MTKLSDIIKPRNKANSTPHYRDYQHEYCTNCDAILNLQKGYNPDLPYWECQGCGQLLINPNIEDEDNVVWVCDECGDYLNAQPGFKNNDGVWTCTKCGYNNSINESEIYTSDEDFQANKNSPYRNMNTDDLLEVLSYIEVSPIKNRNDIILVKDESDSLYVKKILSTYDEELYRYLLIHPVSNIPKLVGVFSGNNKLIVVEEYIEGQTLSEAIEKENITESRAINIAIQLCQILINLHNLEKPIIHRDIKPSNIIIKETGEVYLLDINVAKWSKPGQAEDTRLLGTLYYAAPEQLGYGFSASTDKTDIYSLGILLNVLLTGKMPKEQKAPEYVWPIIEKCISLNPEDRPTDLELLEMLKNI